MSEDDKAEIGFDQIGGMPTPEQTGTVWNSMPNASIRNVAEKMTHMGWKISAKTVARHREKGFVSDPDGKKPKNGQQKSHDTRRKLVDAADKVAALAAMKDSPELATVREVLANSKQPEHFLTYSSFDDLMQKKTLDLKEQFSKTTMAAGIMLAEAVIARREALSLMPKDVGSFLNDMSEVADNLKLTGDDVAKDELKVIEVVADGPTTSALSSKIAQFRKAAEKVPA